MTKEIWKDITNYEGVYKISNFGMVMSLSRKIRYTHAKTGEEFYRVTKQKTLSARYCRGYRFVTLSKNNKEQSFRICRIVATHFIENTDDKPHVNHIDGVKDNDKVENLEWCTPKENISHAIDLGLISRKKGKNVHNSLKVKCTKTGLRWDTIKDAAVSNGLNKSTLSRKLKGVYTNDTTLVYDTK